MPNVELSKNQLWKILDAIIAYKKDYNVSKAVAKLLDEAEQKLKEALNE